MKTITYRMLAVVMGLALTANVATAQVTTTIIDSDFTAAEGYVDGKLQFQGDSSGVMGTWLGQVNNDTQTPGVDSVAGTVTHTGEGFFLRNLFNQGATGGMAGGDGSNEAGNGFNVGDKLRIEHTFSFTLVNETGNHQLASIGVRENFVNGGFSATPTMGFQFGYNPFADGTLKLFTNGARAVFNGADNPFAFFVSAEEAGLDNGFSGPEPIDLVSDNIKMTWEAEFLGADTWKSTELIFENLDTALVKMASVDNPDALEETTYAGTEAFLAMLPIRGSVGSTNVTDVIKYEYIANVASPDGDFDADTDVDGADFLEYQRDTNLTVADLADWNANYGAGTATPSVGAVPEPGAFCLLGLAAMGLIGLRKRG